MAYVRDLRTRDVAEQTRAANEQHYEVPAPFYDLCLGPWKKYSCGLWPPGVDVASPGGPVGSEAARSALAASEEAALELVIERARLAGGEPLRVLDMGCGWGSATLFIASRLPQVQMVAVSNSHSQRAYIEGQARARNLTNVTVLTADINAFEAPGKFDRVISIEMMEHAKNYEKLLGRVASWLRPGGLFFVHIFTARDTPFHYETGWMARTFFSGGQMPSDDLLLYFQRDVALVDHWVLPGTHYAATCNAWLAQLDSHREAALEVLAGTYGEREKGKWLQYWRLFFIACAELFDYDGGNVWAVSHYLFERK